MYAKRCLTRGAGGEIGEKLDLEEINETKMGGRAKISGMKRPKVHHYFRCQREDTIEKRRNKVVSGRRRNRQLNPSAFRGMSQE